MTETTVEVRLLSVDEWTLWRELRLAALASSSEAFRATYEYWSGEGDREENWRSRLENRPFNAVVLVAGCPSGMVSATGVDDHGVVELHSMWVAPSARGRGVGHAAVDAVVAWASEHGASSVWLSVVAANESAIALYARHGFVDDGVPAGHPDERAMRLILVG